VDNTSDHDPIIVSLDLDVNFVGLSQRNITPRVSWARAANSDLEAYSRNLSCLLSDISLPVDAVLCCNLSCNNLEHVSAISMPTVCLVHAQLQLLSLILLIVVKRGGYQVGQNASIH